MDLIGLERFALIFEGAERLAINPPIADNGISKVKKKKMSSTTVPNGNAVDESFAHTIQFSIKTETKTTNGKKPPKIKDNTKLRLTNNSWVKFL